MAVTKEQRLGGSRRTSGDAVPPEGGWGWMVVAGCFLATICIRAVTRCVSMFFVEFQLHFDKDYSTTAWIHSLIDSTTMLCAPLGGFLASRLSCRATVMLGGLLSAAGLVLSSFASSLEYLYAFLGILTGLGFALSYTPAIAMVGRYFNERKALAYGIALSGSGIGTFVLAPVVQLLIENYSWRGALLILGGFVSNLCVCGALMRSPEPGGEGDKPAERKLVLLSSPADMTIAECILFSNKLTESVLGEMKRSDSKFANGSTIEDMKLVESMILSSKSADKGVKMEDSGLTEAKETDVGHFGDAVSPRPPPPPLRPSSRGRCFGEEFGFLVAPDFLILSVAFLFLAYGCSAPVVYLVPYALSVGVEHQHAAFLVSIFGVSGILGNITFGWITDRKCLKRYRMLSFMLAIGMEGLCCMFIPLLHSFSLLVPFAVLYGYFDGAYVVLIPVVTSDIVGSTNLPSGLGVVYFLHAIPYLISPPIGGWLVDVTGNYVATFFLSGACFMCSSVVLIATMLVRRCRRSKSDLAAHLYPHLSAAEAAADRQGII
ncbi:putative monocarboxylate transporter 12-B-like [Scophthalmus maximus]|uniref:Putative monocarboxylate transporter 12-B-like n=1 Tax=Scophthalmus maximus TaxID=52904 RepID=A0A2U9CD91_SCOMX|nr:putative monocarboxylate transporter 12-B-like [Scophthalmus maximus]